MDAGMLKNARSRPHLHQQRTFTRSMARCVEKLQSSRQSRTNRESLARLAAVARDARKEDQD